MTKLNKPLGLDDFTLGDGTKLNPDEKARLQTYIETQVSKAVYKPARMVELMADGYSYEEAEEALDSLTKTGIDNG